MGRCPGDETLTLTRCHSCELPQPWEALGGRKSVCGEAHNLRAHRLNFLFSYLLDLLISFFRPFHGMIRCRELVEV